MAKGCPNCGSTEDWFAVGDTGLSRCPACFMTVRTQEDRAAPRNKAVAPPEPVTSRPLTAPEPPPQEEARAEADRRAAAVAKAAADAKATATADATTAADAKTAADTKAAESKAKSASAKDETKSAKKS